MPDKDSDMPRGGFVERANLRTAEFIVLAAALSAMGAMSIDIMLPLLPEIGASFDIADENRRQLVVVAFSLAFAMGQLLFAPLSDRFGRKILLLTGIGLYLVGATGSALASSFEWLLVLRFIQGLGASTLRSVIIAMVRDCFVGDAMSRVMTFIFTVFMLIPMAAPFMGQFIGHFWGWQAIFWFLAAFSLVLGIWIAVRLRETLPLENRRAIAPKAMWGSFVEVTTNRITVGYTIAAAFSFAGLLSYIVSSQQIYAELYELGSLFSVAFAGTALFSAAGSLFAARLIRLFGARFTVHSAISINAFAAFILLLASLGGKPPLALTFILLSVSMAVGSFMQGNANALALGPIGHIAGIGSAIIGFLSMTFGVFLAGFVGQAYNNTVQPLALTICVGNLVALGAVAWAERGQIFRIKT